VAENDSTQAEIELLESKNEDVGKQIQETEIRVHEQEHKLYICRREIEAQRILNNKNKHANEDLDAEKEALEQHATTMHL
jgi:septal ring factor EnvC (AmiA/AmiB activator)